MPNSSAYLRTPRERLTGELSQQIADRTTALLAALDAKTVSNDEAHRQRRWLDHAYDVLFEANKGATFELVEPMLAPSDPRRTRIILEALGRACGNNVHIADTSLVDTFLETPVDDTVNLDRATAIMQENLDVGILELCREVVWDQRKETAHRERAVDVLATHPYGRFLIDTIHQSTDPYIGEHLARAVRATRDLPRIEEGVVRHRVEQLQDELMGAAGPLTAQAAAEALVQTPSNRAFAALVHATRNVQFDNPHKRVNRAFAARGAAQLLSNPNNGELTNEILDVAKDLIADRDPLVRRLGIEACAAASDPRSTRNLLHRYKLAWDADEDVASLALFHLGSCAFATTEPGISPTELGLATACLRLPLPDTHTDAVRVRGERDPACSRRLGAILLLGADGTREHLDLLDPQSCDVAYAAYTLVARRRIDASSTDAMARNILADPQADPGRRLAALSYGERVFGPSFDGMSQPAR